MRVPPFAINTRRVNYSCILHRFCSATACTLAGGGRDGRVLELSPLTLCTFIRLVSPALASPSVDGADSGVGLNAVVCSRVRELQDGLSAGTIALEIASRNARVAALQTLGPPARRPRPDPRSMGRRYGGRPRGAGGLQVRGYKRKEADRLVTRRPRRGLAGRRTRRPRAAGCRGIGPVEVPS
jgi:hypothetical protein